ncbi:MAG: HD-GYP domain-containing protein [Desulfovibrio sp.]|nr:HD-GYP domain-containing protein [Desulfovibrio sp.]MBI4960729.1 HD-GYP domain-containing protein [Desulfovibrio sp.]
MLKKIPLNDLKPGMFVSAFDLSWFKHPYVSTRLGLVRDQNLIEELRRLGVSQVEVDTSRSALAPKAPPAAAEAESLKKPRATPCPPISDPERTARFAKKLFDQAMSATKALMDSVTKGNAVDIEELQPLIAKLIDSVNQNENVLHVLFSLKTYDDYTYTHSLNLAGLGVLLGKSMGLETADLETLGLAGILHDVGKCLVPKEIIAKPSTLTPAEFEAVKLHPCLGYEHLRRQGNIPEIVLRAVLEHHERIDGKGYPAGLTRDAIHPFSSIISVVDVYDALTSDRAYRSPVSPYLALRTLFSLRGQAFPEDMVDRFIKHLGVYPAYSVVQLRNGCYALVVKQTPGKPLFPEVMVFCDSNRRPVVKRKVDTWRLCGEMARKEFEIERPVEPDELSAPTAAGIA